MRFGYSCGRRVSGKIVSPRGVSRARTSRLLTVPMTDMRSVIRDLRACHHGLVVRNGGGAGALDAVGSPRGWRNQPRLRSGANHIRECRRFERQFARAVGGARRAGHSQSAERQRPHAGLCERLGGRLGIAIEQVLPGSTRTGNAPAKKGCSPRYRIRLTAS
jgi:hypothetical protein